MKNVLRITAILNLLLVVIALSFTFISAITKNVGFLAVGVAFVLASIFPTALMLVLCSDFRGPSSNEARYYYLKSEADKVIAELEKKLDLYKRGWEENDKVNAHLYAELRHQKYKRCLAMTECRDAQARLFHRFGTEVMVHQLYGMEPEVDMEQMDRRSSRCRLASQLWKKRAEKFKEADDGND